MLNVPAFGTGKMKAERESCTNIRVFLLGNINKNLEVVMLWKIAW